MTYLEGVTAKTVDQFRQVNGFSNMFWVWGGKDDDMSKKLYISRYPANIASFWGWDLGGEDNDIASKLIQLIQLIWRVLFYW